MCNSWRTFVYISLHERRLDATGVHCAFLFQCPLIGVPERKALLDHFKLVIFGSVSPY